MAQGTRQTPTEFVVWLFGFLDSVEGAPTPEQWAKIREKHAEAFSRIAEKKLRGEDIDTPNEWYEDFLKRLQATPQPAPLPFYPPYDDGQLGSGYVPNRTITWSSTGAETTLKADRLVDLTKALKQS